MHQASSTPCAKAPRPAHTSSWVLRETVTGRVIAETFDANKVAALNTARYEAVPVVQHLHEVNTPGTLAYRVARGETSPQAPAAVRPSGQPTNNLRRGHVGIKLESGEVVATASGRSTTPFPQVSLDTNRKATSTLKRVERWLMVNASDEALARGDSLKARIFLANQERPSQSDKDSAEEYLFGEQPAVPRSILRTL